MPVTRPITPQKVRAWVVWEDGVEELIDGVAIAWTRRAVRVRFGIPGRMHEVWVGLTVQSPTLWTANCGPGVVTRTRIWGPRVGWFRREDR